MSSKLEAIKIYSGSERAQNWLQRFAGQPWSLSCIFGFTETGLIPGISAAGKTPSDRRWTAYADAEFLFNGASGSPFYPLPPLEAGLSPALISRAILEAQNIPVTLFNAGLLSPKLSSASVPTNTIPTRTPDTSPPPPFQALIPAVDLGGTAARCVSTGKALDLSTVHHLFQAGLTWGETLASQLKSGYLVLGECVVGGTTTALGVLSGLGVAAFGRVNSSHPHCNHGQKQTLVQQGLQQADLLAPLKPPRDFSNSVQGNNSIPANDPFQVIAAVGDPMQITVAGMAIAASRTVGVLLAGGTQMLAVYALASALHQKTGIPWNPDRIVVGTTRWVAADPTGDTLGLVQAISDRFPKSPGPILLGTQLDFSQSRHRALKMYEAGFVKEGVGAGGSAIAATLRQTWSLDKLREVIDEFGDRYYAWRTIEAT